MANVSDGAVPPKSQAVSIVVRLRTIAGEPLGAPAPTTNVMVGPSALILCISQPEAVLRPVASQNFRAGVVTSEIWSLSLLLKASLVPGEGSSYHGVFVVGGFASTIMVS